MTAPDGCGGHPGIGEDLRALALTALDRIDPVLERMRSEPAGSTDDGASDDGASDVCASCPVCAVIAALRGERPELAVRLAEHAAGLVAVLRAALEEGTPVPPPADATERPARPARRVQRIRVERQAR